MKHENRMEFRLFGRRALFSEPETRPGGEKISYPIPTYEALKGICEAIYWKPTLTWVVDKIRIMNKIVHEPVGIRWERYESGKSDLSSYTYLSDVEYQVSAHFEWNKDRPDLSGDRNANKHNSCVSRHLERGGRYDIFLGTRECQGYVEPCEYGSGKGYYDGSGETTFGLSFHGFDYPLKNGQGGMYARFWKPHFSNGEVKFIRPEECEDRRIIRLEGISRKPVDGGKV